MSLRAIAPRLVPVSLIVLSLLIMDQLAVRPSAQSELLPYAVLRTAAGVTGPVWPGDFNEDGITDLASGGETIQVRMGNGDGTFDPPVTSTLAGPLHKVHAVSDFNADGLADLVAASEAGLLVLTGNGDGTFGAPTTIPADIPELLEFAIAADIDGDSNRDLIVPAFSVAAGSWVIAVHPGRGDGTFLPPLETEIDGYPRQASAADLNEDGRLDLAVAAGTVRILINTTPFAFTESAVTVPAQAMDVTVRDLDGDNHLDMVVAATTDTSYYIDGFVYFLKGSGAGTFAHNGSFETAKGPISIVVGDFTRDGRLDVATANLSYTLFDDCAYIRGSDSVSILPGNGNGTFGRVTSFALGPQTYGADLVVNEVESLNTSDLNGDGHLDLIASDGLYFLNAAPRANRRPVALAGADEVSEGAGTIILRGGGTDPDGHLLAFRFFNESRSINVPSNLGCVEFLPAERHELTLNVWDGHALATDTVVYDFRFTDPGPAGWTNQDIGAVGAEGSSIYNQHEHVFTVEGSGRDIWGSADEFHFVSTPFTGDFTIYTQVLSVENVNRWTKAGLMVRESMAAGARHASIFATPTTERGIAFQRRTTTNGASVHTAGPAVTAPIWIMLKRSGDLISAYYQQPGTNSGWIVLGRETLSGLAQTVNVGLAVSSHVDGELATARFGDLILFNPVNLTTSADIGAVGVAGTTSFDSNRVFTQEGSGADIWGTADAFRYHYLWWTSDASLTVRVRSIEPTHRWAKLGVMFRETLDPGSRHVMLIVSSSRGIAMQYRGATGGVSEDVAITSGSAPEWLRLTRRGNTFTGYASEDGTTWRTIGTIDLPIAIDMYVGMALTSHDNTQLATGVYEDPVVGR